MPRAMPSPAYAIAMQHLEARTLPTSGAGNLCLFYALDGDAGASGRLADVQGAAAAPRVRAGAPMRPHDRESTPPAQTRGHEHTHTHIDEVKLMMDGI